MPKLLRTSLLIALALCSAGAPALLGQQTTKLQSRLSAFGLLQSYTVNVHDAVNRLTDTKLWEKTSASSTDIGVSASSTAEAVSGRYSVEDGQCHWVKQYIDQHNLFYKGYNEGKGIWGTWELVVPGASATGGFHIWPEGEADPTRPHLEEAVDQPVEDLVAAPA